MSIHSPTKFHKCLIETTNVWCLTSKVKAKNMSLFIRAGKTQSYFPFYHNSSAHSYQYHHWKPTDTVLRLCVRHNRKSSVMWFIDDLPEPQIIIDMITVSAYAHVVSIYVVITPVKNPLPVTTPNISNHCISV